MGDKYAIKITTPENPIKCHNMLTQIKNGKKELSPEFGQKFLQSTNNRKNISVFLEILKMHLEDKAQDYSSYRYILHALIRGREQTANIHQLIAEIALKYTNLNKVDKYDRIFIENLSKIELPPKLSSDIKSLSEKIPVNVDDIVGEVTEKIINEKPEASEISNFIIQELPEKKKKNILKRIINKLWER